jgi:tripartite-type tricarboxylate transporter receptor subunit TctC
MMRCIGWGVAVLMAAVSSAAAQDATPYPNQMVRIVVPFSAGSNTDGQARIIAD